MTLNKKRLGIFGSTGSIGRNTLEVVRQHPDRFRVQYLSANQSSDLLCSQMREFHPRTVAVVDPKAYRDVRGAAGRETTVLAGIDGLMELARRQDYDMLVNGMVGFAGMAPTIAAIEAGKNIALANKETLVVAGEIISRLTEKHDVMLIPVDSEHSAIFQCLVGESESSVSRIILTASGGPFRGRSAADLRHATPAEALQHPNWKMGHKITIDSATLMNKGLEVMEAHWLFNLPAERIDVLIHPQSIIHSMVEFADGSVKAQLGVPDMKLPIHYALTYPHRVPSTYKRVDFARHHTLTFERLDRRVFRCLQLAYDALNAGGTAPACLNAANEIAVQAFLDNELPFTGIPRLIEESLGHVPLRPATELDTIVEIDSLTRIFARERIKQYHLKTSHIK